MFIAGNGSFRQVAQDVRDLLQGGPQVFGELAHWHPHIHAPVPDGQDSPGSSLAFQTLSQYLPEVLKSGFLSAAELIGSVLFHDPYGAEFDHLNEMLLDVISGSNDAPPRNSKERRDKAELEIQVAQISAMGGHGRHPHRLS